MITLVPEVDLKEQIYRLVTQVTDDYLGTRGWSHRTNMGS